MFIYMPALIFNLAFNLILRIGFFFRLSVKNDFFLVTKELEIFSRSCITRNETFDINDLSGIHDDPLCIHCMSWLINDKSIVICENF